MINSIGSVLVTYNPQRKRHFRPNRVSVEPVQINNERKEVGKLLFYEANRYRQLGKYERALMVLEENRSDIEFALGRSIAKEIFEVGVLTMKEKANKVRKEFDENTYEEVMDWIKENKSNKKILEALMKEGYDFDDLKGFLIVGKIAYLNSQERIDESNKLYLENEILIERSGQRAANRLKKLNEKIRKKRIN